MRFLSILCSGRGAASATLVAALCVGGPLRAEPSPLPPEVGYNFSELELPRTAAMGGALRAFSNSLEALQNNPANLAATRVYHIGGGAQFWTGANRQSYNVSIVDSVVSRSRLAGGVSANWLFQDPDGVDRQGLDVRFGLAFPVSDKLLIGASGRYLDLSQDGYPRGRDVLPPSAASSGLDGESIVKDITFDAGVSVRPAPGLALSLVGQNLTDPGHGFLPLLFGGGVGYGSNLFTIEADLVGDFTSYEDTELRGMGGVEYLAAGQYPIRLGYRYDGGQSSHALSGGLGYAAREFAIDASLRHVFGDDGLTAIFIGLKYHVESLGIGRGDME
jgi:opacity protein-like surface antigen